MKTFISLCFFCAMLSGAIAQSVSVIDTSLKFNKRFTKCERKWVVMQMDTGKSYSFGFIYIDDQAGFTFDLKGTFKVDENRHYLVDTTITKSSSIKYRIAPNWRRVALLPALHFDELHIKPQPDWIKFYYNYTDTLAHDYRWGWIYNDLNECEIALTYLEQAYGINQHAHGVEFEMAFAYNALQRYDDAIKVLGPAIANKPDNGMFYKELAYAYTHKGDDGNAIATFKKGLAYFPDEQSDAKGEMAFNLAGIYKKNGNIDEYNTWMKKAKTYAPTTSVYYKQIVDAGF